MGVAGIEPGALHLIREALCQLSYPPARSRSSRVCPAPRSGARRTCGPLWARCYHVLDRSFRRQRCCLCHSPTLRPWIAGLGRGVLRGGVLEPDARRSHYRNVHAKATRTYTRESSDRPWRTFLSQAGPQVGLELFKLSITFWLVVADLPSETKKATHWVALPCGGVYARSSEHTSRKGRIRCRTGASDRSYAGTK
jgi:hypothetical protein